MIALIVYVLASNILIIPFVIYLHVQGECKLLVQFFSNAKPFCSYISNPFTNILYINLIIFVIALLIYLNSRFPHSESYHKSKPEWTNKKRRS